MSDLQTKCAKKLAEAFGDRDEENDFNPARLAKIHQALLNCVEALEAGAEFYKQNDVNGQAGEICFEALAKLEREVE